eukprot:m.25368 g.25368  ORF g.25368 m.25368 type:complete len:422 (-) comp9744_c0_seq1:989-2254(-)
MTWRSPSLLRFSSRSCRSLRTCVDRASMAIWRTAFSILACSPRLLLMPLSRASSCSRSSRAISSVIGCRCLFCTWSRTAARRNSSCWCFQNSWRTPSYSAIKAGPNAPWSSDAWNSARQRSPIHPGKRRVLRICMATHVSHATAAHLRQAMMLSGRSPQTMQHLRLCVAWTQSSALSSGSATSSPLSSLSLYSLTSSSFSLIILFFLVDWLVVLLCVPLDQAIHKLGALYKKWKSQLAYNKMYIFIARLISQSMCDGYTLKVPELTAREARVLKSVRGLMGLVSKHKALAPAASKTMRRLQRADSTFSELEVALLSDGPHLSTRMAYILITTNTSELVKCIRYAQDSSPAYRSECHMDRELFHKLLLAVVSETTVLCTHMTDDDASRYGGNAAVFKAELERMRARVADADLETDVVDPGSV